jgi:serine/threonine protein kinase/Flp pilus assembly protein TadD
MLNQGDCFQHYEIIRLIGRGGMGEVYLARDTILERHVALKFLPEELANDARMKERFVREARSAAALDHPFICKIYETGTYQGQGFIAMEYIEGETLKDRMERERIPLKDAVRITLEIGEALENAHKAGIIHRDLKPANIMLSCQGHAKVMDFGLAKRVLPGGGPEALSRTLTQASITEQGSIAGTLAYMSPEQAKSEPIDGRSDIFSLGIILYEMLAGKHPFSKNSPIETLTSILRDAVPPTHVTPKSVNPVLNPILQKALAKNPADRYQHVADLARDLRKAGAETGFRVHIPLRPALVALGSLLLVGLVVLGISKFKPAAHRGASQRPSAVQKPITVLIADFDNRTGEAEFEGAFEQAFGLGLGGAPFVKIFSRTQAKTLMNELDPEANGGIRADAAPLLCSREGINVVITGSIETSGSGYVFDVWALDPLSYLRLAERSRTIAAKAEVLTAADALAREIRDDLSRIPPETVQALSQETFTAVSLEAMRLYARAQDLVLAGKDDEAIQEYLGAIEKDPKLGRAYAGLALVYRNRGQDEQAAAYFEKAMALIDQMTDREKFRTRGAYYFLKRDAKKAIEEYSALIRQFPMDSAAHTNLPLAYFYNREMSRAYDEGRKAAEFAPRNLTARYNLVWYALVAGKFDVAEQEFREVLKINPDFPEAQMTLALILIAQDRPREAEKTYLELSNKGPRPASLAAIGLADLALYEGRLKDARKILDEGIAFDIKNKFADEAALKSLMRAQTLLAQGDRSGAAQAADRVADSSTKGSDLFTAAEIDIQAGQYDRALKLAEALNARLQPELQAYAQIIQGEAAEKKGDLLGAIGLYQKAQGLLDTWLGQLALGRAFLEAKGFIEAHSKIDMCVTRRGEALSIFLDDFPSARYLAPLYYCLGRVQEGVKSPAAKESYQRFLKIRERADAGDPLVEDARRRLNAL